MTSPCTASSLSSRPGCLSRTSPPSGLAGPPPIPRLYAMGPGFLGGAWGWECLGWEPWPPYTGLRAVKVQAPKQAWQTEPPVEAGEAASTSLPPMCSFFFFSHVFLAPSNASHGCWNLIPICPGGLWVPCPHPHCHFLLVAMVTAQEGGTFVGVTPFLSSFPVTPSLGYLSQEPRVRAGHVTAGQAWKAQGYRLLWDFVDQ